MVTKFNVRFIQNESIKVKINNDSLYDELIKNNILLDIDNKIYKVNKIGFLFNIYPKLLDHNDTFYVSELDTWLIKILDNDNIHLDTYDEILDEITSSNVFKIDNYLSNMITGEKIGERVDYIRYE